MDNSNELTCPECHTMIHQELAQNLQNNVPVYCEFCGIPLNEYYSQNQTRARKLPVKSGQNAESIKKSEKKSFNIDQFQLRWKEKQETYNQKLTELQKKWNSRIREFNAKLHERMKKLNQKLKLKLQQIRERFQNRRKQRKTRQNPLENTPKQAQMSPFIQQFARIRVIDAATQTESQPKFDIYTGLPLATSIPIMPTQQYNDVKITSIEENRRYNQILHTAINQPTAQTETTRYEMDQIKPAKFIQLEKEERLVREKASFDPETGAPLSESLRKIDKPKDFTVLEPMIRSRLLNLDLPEPDKELIAKTFIYLPVNRQTQYLDLLEGQDLNISPQEHELVQMLQNLPLSDKEKRILLKQLDYLTIHQQKQYLTELHKTTQDHIQVEPVALANTTNEEKQDKIELKVEKTLDQSNMVENKNPEPPLIQKKTKKIMLTE
jgi:hypothetical protein